MRRNWLIFVKRRQARAARIPGLYGRVRKQVESFSVYKPKYDKNGNPVTFEKFIDEIMRP